MPPLSLPRPVFSVNHHPKSHNIGQAAANGGPLRDTGINCATQPEVAELDSAKSSGYFFLTGAIPSKIAIKMAAKLR